MKIFKLTKNIEEIVVVEDESELEPIIKDLEEDYKVQEEELTCLNELLVNGNVSGAGKAMEVAPEIFGERPDKKQIRTSTGTKYSYGLKELKELFNGSSPDDIIFEMNKIKNDYPKTRITFDLSEAIGHIEDKDGNPVMTVEEIELSLEGYRFETDKECIARMRKEIENKLR